MLNRTIHFPDHFGRIPILKKYINLNYKVMVIRECLIIFDHEPTCYKPIRHVIKVKNLY